MAAKDASFNHITVNADDEDEFVIQAGVRPAATASSQVSDGDAGAEATADGLAAAEAEGVVAPAAVEEPAAAVAAGEPVAGADNSNAAPVAAACEGANSAPAADAARERAEVSASAAPHPAREERREQTIEDLDAGPMSLTQKVVIIAVAVFIVVAAVYFFAFMR